MPRTRRNQTLGIWMGLTGGVTPELTEGMPHIQDQYSKLVAFQDEMSRLTQEQAFYDARKQEVTRRINEVLSEGRIVATTLQTVLKQHFGSSSEKLVEFGIKPFRGLRRCACREKEGRRRVGNFRRIAERLAGLGGNLPGPPGNTPRRKQSFPRRQQETRVTSTLSRSAGEQGTPRSLHSSARKSREDDVPSSSEAAKWGTPRSLLSPSREEVGRPSSLFFGGLESRECHVPSSPANRRAGKATFPPVLDSGRTLLMTRRGGNAAFPTLGWPGE